jgi:hypothetical protein
VIGATVEVIGWLVGIAALVVGYITIDGIRSTFDGLNGDDNEDRGSR